MIYLLPHAMTHAAERFPDREAFGNGQLTLTYEEMAVQMNQLASLLSRSGIRKGDRVGIYLNRSIETATAIYGIMHAGAIYVPLDPKAPFERTRHLINDCQIEILITQTALKKKVEQIIAGEQSMIRTIVGLEEQWPVDTISWEEVKNQEKTFTPGFSILEKDPAYLIYTSGSTGLPKGILHTHSSGLAYARLTEKTYGLNEQDRIGNHAPIFFDISTLGYFTSPLVGAYTLIVSDAHTIFAASLSQLMEKERLTVWYSVPLALTQLLQNGNLEEKNLESLRWVLFGGEPFPPKYLRRLMNQWPQARFSNVYGPAEVNQCTYYHLPAPPSGDEPVPIGQVWDNTEALILSENDEPATTGELLIRSATMMEGYWQNSELTERSIYQRRGRSGIAKRFYRTGDLVREDEEGLLHFLGRKDHQVKVRGYRVELTAIESTLLSHPSVSEAVVYALRDEEGNNSLRAAVILNPGADQDTNELMNFLRKELPHYAIPARLKLATAFPRTGSGKVDRKAVAADLQTIK